MEEKVLEKFKLLSQDLKIDEKFEDCGIDRFDAVEAIVELENEFGVEVGENKVDKVESIGDVIEVFENLTEGKSDQDNSTKC